MHKAFVNALRGAIESLLVDKTGCLLAAIEDKAPQQRSLRHLQRHGIVALGDYGEGFRQARGEIDEIIGLTVGDNRHKVCVFDHIGNFGCAIAGVHQH